MEKKAYSQSKMNKEYKKLVATLGILLGIVVIFIFYLSWPLMTGKTMVLATRPIDPFDIFRGQYITINYEISSISLTEDMIEGDTVYVSLKEDQDKIWRFESVSKTRSASDMFIRGSVKNNERIEYGIEQYFFERNAQFPTNNLTVEVKVSKSGQARI